MNYQSRVSLIIFITIIVFLKVYFLYLSPRPIESYFSNFLFIFFNSKNFFLNPHSFYDWNHIGTPIYFIGKLFLYLGGHEVKYYENFKLYFHFFQILYLIFSINVFFNYYKKKNYGTYFFLFLILLFSYKEFLMSLEVIDPTSLLVPTIILIIVYLNKIYENKNIKYKHILKLSFFSALLGSIKSPMLGLVFTISLPTIFYLFYEQKNKKKTFVFISSMIFFISTFNFPILGRIPVTIFNILFEVGQTTHADFLKIVLNGLVFYFKINPLLFILLFILILFAFYNIIFSKIISLKILQLLSLLLFFYTMIYSFREYNLSSSDISDISFVFRNHFIYIFFVACVFFNNEISEKIKKYKKYLMILGIAIFLSNIIIYENLRSDEIKRYHQKKNLFYYELQKFDKIKNIYLYKSPKFSFNEILLHYSSNDSNSGKLFIKEIEERNNKYSWLHIDDVIFTFEKKEKINKFKTLSFIYAYESFLQRNFTNFFYNSLSFFSLKNNNNLIFNSSRTRKLLSKNFHGKALLAYPTNSILISRYKDKLFKHIENNFTVIEFKEVSILNDNWLFIVIKNK